MTSAATSSTAQLQLGARFRATRQRTLELCRPLTPEDMMVQSSPEASPAKWHLAHTAWFFESFILREYAPGYRLFDADFPWLFNSYYRSFAAFPQKHLRASFSRPGLAEVLRYRAHVDEGIERLLEGSPEPAVLERIELGVNHEEQHQELLLTDILHAFFTNPLRPAYLPETAAAGAAKGGAAEPLRFAEFAGGLREIGYNGEGFSFDNERPRHRVWLEPFALAQRLVTNGEFAAFIADGGYRRPELWLSAGWDAVEQQGWSAPLYWTGEDGDWSLFTLRGAQPLAQMAAAPVSHVSYFEADAYARWAGKRLATEFEWEAAAAGAPVDRQSAGFGADGAFPGHGARPGAVPCAAVRGLLGVDGERLSGLSGFQSAGRIAGRVQWQVHERTDGAARRVLRDARGAHSWQLSQFLSAGDTLAVFRDSARGVNECGRVGPDGAYDRHTCP